MTSLDKDGVTVPALGSQVQSTRRTAPKFGISKVGRSSTESVYISEEHTRTARLGRQSPPGGPVYDLPSTLGGTNVRFSKGPRDLDKLKRTSTTRGRPGEYANKVDDPDDVPTNDALDVQVDSQPFKYRRDPEIIIGTNPRGKLKDAELIKNHSSAFYGRASPGPAAIGDTYGPSVGATKPTFAPAQPFGVKIESTWMKVGDNPKNVGPGAHERRDVSIGQQHLSKRRNQSVHAFPHSPKFPKDKYQDSISVLDNARSCLGRQVLGRNRSEPSINFSADSRSTREKSMICYTRKDEGPRANMPRFTASIPRLC
mmetsp:Transcript_43902/g.139842  ORF Transcript_43902/g.139842 Transcript_43902/m.139842 type:complete len:313 (-) Transcript_43902:1386-2324(-)